jgi:CcmD family protein
MLVFFTTTLYAQQEVEMADTLRTEGKIYVIVGIILIVLAGLFVYLFLLDRKVSRIEREVKK